MSDQQQKPAAEAKHAGPPPLPDNWFQMSGDEKYNHLSTSWASTEGKPFASPEIEAAYRRRAQRWLDVVALKKPDRVPSYFLNGEFATNYAGCKPSVRFYDQEKTAEAVYQFHQDFNLDQAAVGMPVSGRGLDTLGYIPVRWPGSRLNSFPEDMQFQYVEKEYMKAEDYDELIADPEGYTLYKYVPAICDGLKSLAMGLNPMKLGELGGVLPMLMGLSFGPVRQALDTLLKAADQTAEDMRTFFPVVFKIQSLLGMPNSYGGASKAPFDILGDTMRGTQGIMLDMYRRPEKVEAACQALIPSAIKMAVGPAMFSRIPFVTLYLHKGADGFMSNEQFARFYWPSLKAAMMGMINAGLIPFLFVQGSYDQRLDIIAESGLPAGRSVWLFDRTDMKAVKEKLGDMICFGGNVPSSLFSVGTPEKMAAYCKDLIETVAGDGGFFLAPGAAIDQAKPENVKAFLESTRKYGKY